jgi:uncharacterized membrane protein YedE/YeeE
MRLLSFVVLGALFAAGLVLSGMTQPSKVIGFLDVGGSWDPSLLLVMAGAIFVHAVSYRLVRRRKSPLLALNFEVPTRTDITPQLLGGAALFGIGWGLAGYCPGPAISSLVTGETNTIIFMGALVVAMVGYSVVTGRVSGPVNRGPAEGDLGTSTTLTLPERQALQGE